VKAHCLPFSKIPHTSRLFSDFLTYPPDVKPFYPHSPFLKEWLRDEAKNISYDPQRRARVADILEKQNQSWDVSAKTKANIERFHRGAFAVVTGQQVGLFGGPMFAIYKALTAVKLAEQATAAGVDAVPVFWLATYDHDLAEVNHVAFPGPDGALQTFTASSRGVAGAPVSAVRLGEEIVSVVDEACALLGDTEASKHLRDSYRPGESMGTAFARLYARLFADWGVILLDASDAELHAVASPVYRDAIERADELQAALLQRGEALEAAGYHQQVKVTPSSVLVFTTQDGARTAIQRRGSGAQEEFVIGADANAERVSKGELLDRLSKNPGQFTPNVLLRPVVEDYLLPTLVYTGGAAETAYFAQAAAVYDKLLGRVTPIAPRFSATLVEPKMQRLLEKHGLAITDLFEGPESVRRLVAARSLPSDLQASFDSAKESFEANFSALKEKLEKLDRTLVDAAETSRSKMQHQLEKLYAQAARAEAQKGELVTRHAEALSQALYPEKGLQERTVGGLYFLARYGSEILQQLYETIHPDCHDHQVVEL